VPSGDRYEPSPDAAYTAVSDGAVIIHLGTNRYFSLNTTAATVWTMLDAGADTDAIAVSLARDFEVDDTTAREAVARTIAQFVDAGLVRHRAD
jgi:coenzyme PQQ synthesis protein D (PqqD)